MVRLSHMDQVLRRATVVLALSIVTCMLFLPYDQSRSSSSSHSAPSLSLGVAGASSLNEDTTSFLLENDHEHGGLAMASRPTTKKQKAASSKTKKHTQVHTHTQTPHASGEGTWIESRSPDGRMTTAYLKQPGSKGTIGLRGEAIVDHHISAILNVFLNTSLSTEWVSYLDYVEEHATPKRNKHLIYQFFDMPRPLSDREFLMERTVESNKKTKTVIARYQSVEHPVKPTRKSVVRGEAHGTFWKFRSLGKGQTQIEVESTLNPKLPINGWVVNMMQTSYQKTSLLSMLDLVKGAEPHPEFAHW